ncbi:MAG: hypothetical protein ACK55I_21000, partial [bacterium]
MAVVQHVGLVVLGHLAAGPVLEALKELVDADAISRAEGHEVHLPRFCLLYTSDAADDNASVDLGGCLL